MDMSPTERQPSSSSSSFENWYNALTKQQKRAVLDWAILVIDGEMKHLVKRALNFLCPIQVLPSEILLYIFSILKYQCEEEFSSCVPMHSLNWIQSTTHVCSWWREIALDDARLWTNPPMFCRLWALEMLMWRSKDAALTITANFSTVVNQNDIDQMIRRVLWNIFKVDELNLLRVPFSSFRSSFVCLQDDAPSEIHTLRIIPAYNSEDDFDEGDIDVWQDHIPQTKFLFPPYEDMNAESMPLLRRLSLTSCNLNWETSILRNITHIRINSSNDIHTFYSLFSFLEGLRNAPALESLDFSNLYSVEIYAGDRPHLPEGFVKVSLPNLKLLRLFVEMDCMPCLLEGLEFSPTTLIKVFCQDQYTMRSDTDPALPRILTALAKHFTVSEAPLEVGDRTIRSMELSHYGELTMRTWSSVVSSDDMVTLHILPVSDIFLGWRTIKNDFPDQKEFDDVCLGHIKTVFDILPLDHLTSLSITQCEFNISAVVWYRSIGRLPALEYVHVSGSNIVGLFIALMYGSDKTCMRFPALRSISMEHNKFNENNGFIKQMVEILILRYELGREVEEIVFKDCDDLYDADVELVREVVVDVKVQTVDELPQNPRVKELKKNPQGFHDEFIDDLDILWGVWY